MLSRLVAVLRNRKGKAGTYPVSRIPYPESRVLSPESRVPRAA